MILATSKGRREAVQSERDKSMTLRKTIQPLGFLADGAPFWAYFGAEGEDDGGGDNPGDGGENDEDD